MPDLAIALVALATRTLGVLTGWLAVAVAVGTALLVAFAVQFLLLARSTSGPAVREPSPYQRSRRPRRPASDDEVRGRCRLWPRAWMRWVIWTAILAPVPYSLSRLLWALGIPLGIDEALLRNFDSPGLGSLYILALALLPEATAIFTHTFVLTRPARVPDRAPGVGGRPVRPALVVGPLLAPIIILGGFNLWSLGPILDGFVIPASNDGLPGWSFWGQVASFWLWGVSLTVATAAYWWTAPQARDRGRRMGVPT